MALPDFRQSRPARAMDPRPTASTHIALLQSRLAAGAPAGVYVMDLATSYLGLMLPHPFLAGASPLTQDLDSALRLQDAGAPAIVRHSLFEEDLVEQGAEPHEYLTQVLRIKRRTNLPVIASLNGTTAEGWLRYATLLEHAGASAIELNFYHVATDPREDGVTVEHRVVDIVAVLKESIRIDRKSVV